tara:strand:- start:2330 stop:2803 length:474 start_codon:yes stop_codon:yes gene_type:complete
LYAEPVADPVRGFYFEEPEEFEKKASKNQDYNVQFIDGSDLDCELFKVLDVGPETIPEFFNAVEEWDDYNKLRVIIYIRELGSSWDLSRDDPNDLYIDIYMEYSLEDLAKEFVAEGIFGDVSSSLTPFIDYEELGRYLSYDYTETVVGGMKVVYRAH